MAKASKKSGGSFDVVEATIDDLHGAIREGRTTLVEVVQQFIDRARAYNGAASMLVTEDGMPVPAADGVVRAGAAIEFPTETVKASDVLPDLDRYTGRRSNTGGWRRRRPTPTCRSSSACCVASPRAVS